MLIVGNAMLLVRQVLVIFSDGLDEDVMKLEQESELLRESGNGQGGGMLITWGGRGSHGGRDGNVGRCGGAVL